jgi:membrane fusion protein, peptide pheromone/bacteriocin exporter
LKPIIIQNLPLDHEIKFLSDRRVKSGIIYISVLVCFLGCICALPLVRVSLSVQGRGIIRPVSELAEVRVIPTAAVKDVYITEGVHVSKGDTLLTLSSVETDRQIDYRRYELIKLSDYISDLQLLTGGTTYSGCQTDLYKTEQSNVRKKLAEINSRIERANRDIARQKKLYENLLISKKEFEDLLFYEEQLESERKIYESSNIIKWEAELTKLRSERDDCLMQTDLLKKQKELFIIRSPVDGTVESFTGIYSGSNLQSGQVVAIVSPSNAIIAEVYVPAGNVGMLKNGMPVRIQVDAFNYNEWGMLSGRISGISDDYFLVNNVPVFKVKCSLNTNMLRLKNGIPGTLKKGMTLNARFMIAKRSLFQLLYQKSDDWLNPSRNLTAN